MHACCCGSWGRIGSLAAALVLWLSGWGVAGGEPEALVALRDIYARHMQQIQADYQAQLEAGPKNYLRDLQGIGARFQQAGDLDGWRAVREEAARFRDDPTIPQETERTAPSELHALHAQHRTRADQFRRERSRQIDDLTSRYVARLEALQTERTRAGDIEEALQYNAEIGRAEGLPAVTSARFELAAQEREKLAATLDPGGEEIDLQDDGAEEGDEEDFDPGRLPSGVSIVEGGVPPRDADLTFRTHRLSATSRMRLTRNLSVRGRMATESDMSSTRSSSYFHRSSSRTGSQQYHLQLGVRSASTTDSFRGTRLLVDYYGRPADGGGQRLVPRLLSSQFIDLPVLDAERWVYVTLAPVSVQSSYHRSSSSFMGTSTSRRGQEFHGVVVSVFDENDALIYQGSCSRDLDSAAPAEFPQEQMHNRAVQAARQRMDSARLAMDHARRTQTEGGSSDAYQQAWREYSEAQQEYYRLRQ